MEFQDEAKVSSCHLNRDIRRQGGELPEPQPGNRNQGSGMRTNKQGCAAGRGVAANPGPSD